MGAKALAIPLGLMIMMITASGAAALTSYDSLATFQAATDSVLRVSYPAPFGPSTEPYLEGGFKIDHPSETLTQTVGQMSVVNPGNEMWTAGAEHLDIDARPGAFPAGILAFGFFVVDYTAGVQNPCIGEDSQFDVAFYSGGNFLESEVFDPAADTLVFRGYFLGQAFDRVQIREVIDGEQAPIDDPIGPGCEDDVFGKMYARSTSTLMPVPEFTTMALVAAAFVILGWVAWTRSSSKNQA